MKKRILAILLACVMLLMAMPFTVSAAGTQEDPIDAATKWFGYGVDTYLLNPTIAEGTTDGIWYTLTAEDEGILFLEHSYKNVDYTIYVTLNGETYVGGCVDGEPYNRPIVTAPVAIDDVITIQIVTKDAAAGTVYANMNIIYGDENYPVKVKSDGLTVVIGAGQTVYFQDDSLNAIYATKGLLVEGDVADTTFYSVYKNTENGTVSTTAFTDDDADGVLEVMLGGSLGGAGIPPVKPAWAIENNSDVDQYYTLIITDDAHECHWDDDFDTDCNTCGDVREFILPVVCGGSSISEDVNGLACRYDIQVEGMATDGTTAIYDNATFAGMKLVSMGAVVCNNFAETLTLPTLEDVDGQHVLDIPVKNLYSYNVETHTASYAIRIINIPDYAKDTYITFVPYVIVEDAEGSQHTLYINSSAYGCSYNVMSIRL